jgi:hypothetical protein
MRHLTVFANLCMCFEKQMLREAWLEIKHCVPCVLLPKRSPVMAIENHHFSNKKTRKGRIQHHSYRAFILEFSFSAFLAILANQSFKLVSFTSLRSNLKHGILSPLSRAPIENKSHQIGSKPLSSFLQPKGFSEAPK